MCAETDYMYIFIRGDLSSQQQIIQAAHSSTYIGSKYGGDSHIVLCGVKCENGLYDISEYLEGNSIDFHMFYEPDVKSYTSLTTEPLKGDKRKLMKKFKLLR